MDRKPDAISEFERALGVIRILRKREPDNQRFPQDEAELVREMAVLRGH
jgi:hypothetical protein